MTSPLRNESLNSLDQHRLDFAKDAFKSSLHGGRQPRIEDFLPFVPDELQSALLPELFLVEFGFRRVAGDSVSTAEYVARFPKHSEMISKLVEQSASSGGPSGSAPKVKTAREGQTVLVGANTNARKRRSSLATVIPQSCLSNSAAIGSSGNWAGAAWGRCISRTTGSWIARSR